MASTLALVLALGGVSYAAVTINGKNIKNRTVGAAKIKKNSLTGTEINELKLGKVPSAALADNATNASTVGGQQASSFKLSCPQGLTLAIGQCFETSLRTAANFSDAVKTCGAVGRRVPTFGELESARQNNVAVGDGMNNYELSSTIGADSPNNVLAIDPAGNRLAVTYTDATKRYRCIQNPTN
ncbi:MAG TPA: hypothetical protein VGC98_11060 [Thermoleophilaceae bacterium]